jgi:HPt (histidine-containing phosphotransfer) domain-containing protein
MPEGKTDRPSIATYADHEVINPSHRFRTAVSIAPDSDPDDPVARAERALATLAPEFSKWMEAELDRLDRARRDMRSHGSNVETRNNLFRAAHDIKGEASTFGFPAIAATATSLCHLIEYTPEVERIPLPLVDQHVDAMRAIVRENGRPDLAEIAEALTLRLRDVADDFLARENHHRLEFIDRIISPNFGPSDSSF